MKQIGLQTPAFSYDIHNAEFIDFFIRRTGYRIRSCNSGWEKIRDEFANPAHEIDPTRFKYEKSGLPVPIEEGISIKKVWDITRSKPQASWEAFVNFQIIKNGDQP